MLHIFLYWIFQLQGNILHVTLLTLGLSVLMFLLIFIGFKNIYLRIGFIILILIEPCVVFLNYQQHITPLTVDLPTSRVYPTFQFIRPIMNREVVAHPFAKELYSTMFHTANFQDSSGFFRVDPDLIQSYVLQFYSKLPVDEQIKMARYKIRIFDKDRNSYFNVVQDSKEFKVLHFDVNKVIFETDYPSDIYLTYTDAYSKSWNVFLNNKKEYLDVANNAFKEVFVPKGRNIVEFDFTCPGGQFIYLIVISVLFLSCALLIASFVIKRQRNSVYAA